MTQKNWCRTILHQFFSFIETEFLLEGAVRRGSLSLAKEAELDGFQPPSFAMAAFAAICSAAPEKLRFSGFPYFSILRRAEPTFRQENFRLKAGNFAWTRRSARLAFARKRGRTGRLSAAQLRNGGFRRHLFGRPRKAPLFRVPLFFNPQAGRAHLPARKFPAESRKFCLDAPFGAARFRSQKRPNWTAFSRPTSQWRLSPPFVRPLFCCGPCRSPRGFRSGPPPRKSAYRGRGPPRR